jgi:hypothetical protein
MDNRMYLMALNTPEPVSPTLMNKRVFLRMDGGWHASPQNEAPTAWWTTEKTLPKDKASDAFLAIAPRYVPGFNPSPAQERALRERLDEMPINWQLEVVYGHGLVYANVTAQDQTIGSSSKTLRTPVEAIFEALDAAGSTLAEML